MDMTTPIKQETENLPTEEQLREYGITMNEYLLRLNWDNAIKERDDWRAQALALSAIKKGLESSLKESMREYGEKQSPPPELDAQKMEELRDELDSISDIDKLRDLVVEKKVASLFYARGCLEKHAQILELQRREKQSPRWVKVEHLPISVPANQRLFVRVVKNGYYDCLSAAVLRTPAYQKYGYEYLDLGESESPGSQEAVEFAEWLLKNTTSHSLDKRKHITTDEDIRTTTELYNLFKQTK